VAAKGSSIIS